MADEKKKDPPKLIEVTIGKLPEGFELRHAGKLCQEGDVIQVTPKRALRLQDRGLTKDGGKKTAGGS